MAEPLNQVLSFFGLLTSNSMRRAPLTSVANNQKGALTILKHYTQRGFWLLLMGLFALQVHSQKTIVLVDADIGSKIESIHQFTYGDPTFTFTLKHRLSYDQPLEVKLLRSEKFNQSPYTLAETLPLVINKGEAQDLTFSVDYSKSIRDQSSVTLLIYPQGDKNPKARGITFHVELSAQGKLMFWNDRAGKYVTALAPYSFGSPGDRLIEITWNGNGQGSARLSLMDDFRNAFSIVPNKTAAAAIDPNIEIPLGKGGRSYFVRYNPPGGRRASDGGRLLIQDAKGTGDAISVQVDARGNSSSTLFASNSGVGTTTLGFGNNSGSSSSGNTNTSSSNNNSPNNGVGATNIGDSRTTPTPSREPVRQSTTNPNGNSNANSNPGLSPGSGKPGTTGSKPRPNPGSGNNGGGNALSGSGLNTGTGTPKAGLRPSAGSNNGIGTPNRPVVDAETALTRLKAIYENRKGENFLKIDRTNFERKGENYVARLPLEIDTLDEDPNFKFLTHHIAAITVDDSIELKELAFDEDSMIVRIAIDDLDEEVLLGPDSFAIHVGLIPYYLAGEQKIYLEDQSQMFYGDNYAKVKRESNWLLWLLVGIGSFIFLFFFLGRLWVRRAITSFRYLREARYQRDRFKRQEEETTVATETIYLDLNRHETDLVQLNFLFKDEAAPDGILKRKELDATVQAPDRRGLRRFFVWFFGVFGMKKEPRFNAVYYSFRIEPQKGGIPQHLRLKDDEGLFLLGTSLTGNVLATDHQDFRFTKRPFTYSLFLDPAEILDYTGSMRTVNLLFRIVEEPFEGYFITRDFKLDLEIAPKF